MDDLTARREHLERLRGWRNYKPRDLTLGKLSDHVARTYVKPHQQLGQLIELWQRHIPAELTPHTALAKFQRGVLTVHVADAATQYEIDRLLRAGAEREIARACKTTLRKIRLTIAPIDAN